MASKVAKIALTILACTSLSLPPTAAEAGMRTGTWRNGMVAGPYGVGWYGSHGYFAPSRHARYGGYYPGYYGAGYGAPYGYPGYGSYDSGYYGGYGYAPAYYGGYGYYPGYYYRRRRHDSGAALAAGLIGGMALGAILASSAARAAPRCYVAPRRVMNASGNTYIRRVRVCR
jgi:hypothetical protein